MKVVFVDDERRVLDGLEGMLFGESIDWELAFFESGEDALRCLETEHVDVVVSDMRMPGMDGEQLLTRIAADHPAVIRLVLSGQVEMESARRTLLMAHDFLSKPCTTDDLIQTVNRALALGRSARTDGLRRLAGSATLLPSPPRTHSEIRAAMAAPDFSLDDLADILSQDIALSATVLHLANSAYFARSNKALDVHGAVRRLGTDVISGVVLATEAFASFNMTDIDIDIDIEALNDHAMRTVAAVRAMFPPPLRLVTEVASLHPIGNLVIASLLPEEYRLVEHLTQVEGTDRRSTLEDVLGFTDAHAGAYLLRLWNLDDLVAEAIEHMDGPWRLDGEARRAAGAVWAVHCAAGVRNQTDDTPDPLPDDLQALLSSVPTQENE